MTRNVDNASDGPQSPDLAAPANEPVADPEAAEASLTAPATSHFTLRLPVTPQHPCSYLPDQHSREECFLANELDPETYHDLMDQGFRRSGTFFYRPRCTGCQACVPIRVPVATFRPSKSQRRAINRNLDVHVEVGQPDLTDEKHELYRRYLQSQHPCSTQSSDVSTLREFLYESPVDTIEVMYIAAGRLIAVSLLDACSRSLSSVYHYFDPAEGRRSMGVFSVVKEIELCRELGIAHYYLGFWVADAPTMSYKANYRPHEVLVGGRWRCVD